MQSYPLALSSAMNVTSFANDADHFIYESGVSAGDARIIVRPENGAEIILKPGQSFRIASDASRWFVKSFDGVSTIAGVIIIGSGDFVDNGIVGTVSVVDGAKIRTDAGVAFLISADCAALAANIALSQLWNPVGSGKKIILESFSLASSNTVQIGFGYSALQVATLSGVGVCKKLGGAASVMQARTENASATTGVTKMGSLVLSAAVTTMVLKEPIVINPGFGFIAWSGAVNTDIRAIYEYFEESI